MSSLYKKGRRKRAGTGIDPASQSLLLLSNLEVNGIRNDWEKRESRLLKDFIEHYENSWIEAIIYSATTSIQIDERIRTISASTSESGSIISRNISLASSTKEVVRSNTSLKRTRTKELPKVKIPSAMSLLYNTHSGMPASPMIGNSISPVNNAPLSPRMQVLKSQDSRLNATFSSISSSSAKESNYHGASGKPIFLPNIITSFPPKTPSTWDSQSHEDKNTHFAPVILPWSPIPTPFVALESSSMPNDESMYSGEAVTNANLELNQVQQEITGVPFTPISHHSSFGPVSSKSNLIPRPPRIQNELGEEESQESMTLLQFLKISQTSLENLEVPTPPRSAIKEKRPSLLDLFKRRTSAIAVGLKSKKSPVASPSPISAPTSPTSAFVPRAILKIPSNREMYVHAELMDRIKSPTMYTIPKQNPLGSGTNIQDFQQQKMPRRVLFNDDLVDITEEMKKREVSPRNLNPSLTKKISAGLRSILTII